MIRRNVALSPEALDDLEGLDLWIAEASSVEVAATYVGRVKSYLAGLDLASERGAKRDDVSPGLRIVRFDRRLTIAFSVGEKEVTILRVFRAGEDWGSAFRE